MSEQTTLQLNEFEAFKNLVEEVNPDMTKIKGYLVAHPEWLSDYERFSDLIFPKVSDDNKNAKFIALENTVTALSELKQDGKITNDMLESFASLQDFKGRNVSTFLQEFANELEAKGNSGGLGKIQGIQKLLGDVYMGKSQLWETEKTLRIGGDDKSQNDGITVDGSVDNGVTVDGQLSPSPEKPEEQKIANMVPDETEKEKKPRKPLDIKPVKEQDIIDYMFNDWFLASINWLIKKTYGLLDKGIDYLSTKSELSPKSEFLSKGSARTEKDYENLKLLNQLVDEYPKNLLKEFDKNKESFAQKYGIDSAHLQQNEQGMKKFIKYAALVTVPMYMDKHTDGNPLEAGPEQDKLNKLMQKNLESVFTACKQINTLYANDEQAATKEILTYFKDLTSAAKSMKDNLVDYYKESNKDEKLKKQQEVASSRQRLEQVLGRYENPETQETSREPVPQSGSRTVKEEAEYNNTVDTKHSATQNYVENNREKYLSKREAILARKEAFFAMKARKFPNFVEKTAANDRTSNTAFQQAIISALNTGR